MKSIFLTIIAIFFATFTFSQNVGIGTTAPETKLHVVEQEDATDGIAGVFINVQNASNTSAPGKLTGIRFRTDGVGTPINSRYKGGLLFEKTGSWGVGSLHFATNNEGNNASITYSDVKMTVNSIGNVGIGTTNPDISKLQILGGTGNLFHATNSTNDLGVSMSVPGSSPTLGFNVLLNSGYKFMGTGYAGMFQHSSVTGDLNYFTSNATGSGGNSIGFLGSFFTLDAAGRVGLSNSAPKAKLHVNGNMVIGSTSLEPAAGYLLSIDGRVICEEARVQISGAWPDYVFNDNYKLRPLEELEKLINEQKHLPNIPAAAEVEKEGIALGDMNKRLIEKVEELTLYIIALDKQNKALNERVSKLEKK